MKLEFTLQQRVMSKIHGVFIELVVLMPLWMLKLLALFSGDTLHGLVRGALIDRIITKTESYSERQLPSDTRREIIRNIARSRSMLEAVLIESLLPRV